MRDEIWTVQDVAEHWKISPRTVRDMLCRGELQGFKIRSDWRVPLSAVVEYESQNAGSRAKVTRAGSWNPVVRRIV